MGSPRDPVNHIPKKDVGPPSFPLTASNLNPEIVVRYVQFIPIRLAASLHERDALLELVSLYGSGMLLCACSDRCSEESTAIKRGMARMAPWSAAARSHLGASLRSAATLPPGHSVVRCADRRRASSRLSYQIDRQRRTAVHGEPGHSSADPPRRTAPCRPRRPLQTRPTPISAGETTAEVWMLLSHRGGMSVRMGRKGMLRLGGARQHVAWSLPLMAFLGILHHRGLSRGLHPTVGVYKACYWGQMKPEARMANTTRGVGSENALQPCRLRVSGTHECHHETPGKPTPAAGSLTGPSTAEP
jgi:hypothetical protein